MRFLIALAPLAVLAACASPQQQCLNAVTEELRINAFLIQQTQANLDRGFALDQRQKVTTFPRHCTRETDSGERFTVSCDRTIVRNYSVPQAINMNVERDTLNQLLATRANLEKQASASVAQCRAMYPE